MSETNELEFRLSDADAPMIYFDFASNFSAGAGIFSVTIMARRAYATSENKIERDFVVVGYLRCGMEGATTLRDSLNNAILLGTKDAGSA